MMDVITKFLKDTLPHYLRGLPIPKTFSGVTQLKGDEWRNLGPLLTFVVVVVYLTLHYLFKNGGSKSSSKASKVNLELKKETEKVVDTCDIEDVIKEKDGKKVFCRCWRSKKFPYCDGSHNKHNEGTGDNVGPLIVSSGKKAN